MAELIRKTPERLSPAPGETSRTDMRDIVRKEEAGKAALVSSTITPTPVHVQPPVVPEEGLVAAKEKSPQLLEVERILGEGLDDLYWSLEPPVQEVFKRKGEEVAHTIDGLLNEATFHVKKVLNLIKEWLRIIPHVNQFFLEQEMKIKTDKLREVHDTPKINLR
jgi:hypothetical protein